MEYSEFKERILKSIKEELPDTLSLCDVNIREVIKNNDSRLDGIIINDHTGKPMPTVYLNGPYKDMVENGKSFEEVLSSIVDTIVSNMHSIDFDLSHMTSWENVKSQIVPRVINKARNTELLKQRPHMDITDLSKIYAIDLGDGMSVPITNELMDMWRVSLSDLDENAISNISGHSIFKGMNEILMEMMGGDFVMEAFGFTAFNEDLYVLSNSSGLYGAAQMLDTSLMDSLTSRFKDGFVILPSSTHEVIIAPLNPHAISKADLADIVRQVNTTAVSPGDFLSDNIYSYNSSTHEIERLNLKNDLTHNQEESISLGR